MTLATAAAARAAAAQPIEVGTTCYLSPVIGRGLGPLSSVAERAADAMINRLFLEPNLGMGYPVADAPILRGIRQHVRPGDINAAKVDLDFLGVQYYTRLKAPWLPIPKLRTVPYFGTDRAVGLTSMNWEIRPEGLGMVLDKVWAYGKYPRLIVTEGGASFNDRLVDGRVHDQQRIHYYQDHLEQVSLARARGINVDGYFAWSLLDNFEWIEGLRPRFGVAYVDYSTQQRYLKDSGYWFSQLLGGTAKSMAADPPRNNWS